MKSIFPPIRGGHFFWCASSASGQGICPACESRAYLFVFGLSLLLSVVELYGSLKTQSLGLLSDTFHVFFDSLGYLIGLASVRHGMSVAHDRVRFHAVQSRYETAMGLFLLAAVFLILEEAYRRSSSLAPPEIIETELFFWIASVGLVGNVIALKVLGSIGISHDHGDSHRHSWLSRFFARWLPGGNLILQANISHTFGDTVSSVFVVIVAIVFNFTDNPHIRYLDVVVSVFIALLLLWQAVRLLSGTGHTHEH